MSRHSTYLFITTQVSRELKCVVNSITAGPYRTTNDAEIGVYKGPTLQKLTQLLSCKRHRVELLLCDERDPRNQTEIESRKMVNESLPSILFNPRRLQLANKKRSGTPSANDLIAVNDHIYSWFVEIDTAIQSM